MLGTWIRQTTTTTGTGNLTLSSVSGYPTFSTQFATNQRFKYVILDDSTGAPIEAGIGYLNSTPELVRERIEATMVSGTFDGSTPSAVSLASGTKRVICTGTAGGLQIMAPGVWQDTNKVYGDSGIINAVGTLATTADRAYAVRMTHAVDSEIDAIMFRVTTAAAAGKLAKVAVFSMGADGLPGVSLAESSSIAVDSTGVKTGTFTAFRPPAEYFACFLSDGTPTIQSAANGMLARNAMGMDGSLSSTKFVHHVGATSLTFPTTWTAVRNASNAPTPQLVARCT